LSPQAPAASSSAAESVVDQATWDALRNKVGSSFEAENVFPSLTCAEYEPFTSLLLNFDATLESADTLGRFNTTGGNVDQASHSVTFTSKFGKDYEIDVFSVGASNAWRALLSTFDDFYDATGFTPTSGKHVLIGEVALTIDGFEGKLKEKDKKNQLKRLVHARERLKSMLGGQVDVVAGLFVNGETATFQTKLAASPVKTFVDENHLFVLHSSYFSYESLVRRTAEVGALNTEVGALKTEVCALKTENLDLEGRLSALEVLLERRTI
jgi:hypothetical protein